MNVFCCDDFSAIGKEKIPLSDVIAIGLIIHQRKTPLETIQRGSQLAGNVAAISRVSYRDLQPLVHGFGLGAAVDGPAQACRLGVRHGTCVLQVRRQQHRH